MSELCITIFDSIAKESKKSLNLYLDDESFYKKQIPLRITNIDQVDNYNFGSEYMQISFKIERKMKRMCR